MKRQMAFCSACDKDVHIVITDEPSQEGHANLNDSEIVCLEIGDGCTGHVCPIGGASTTVMAARLVRNGLQTIVRRVVKAHCGGCDQVTSHVIVGTGHATCTECGTMSARSALVIVTTK